MLMNIGLLVKLLLLLALNVLKTQRVVYMTISRRKIPQDSALIKRAGTENRVSGVRHALKITYGEEKSQTFFSEKVLT